MDEKFKVKRAPKGSPSKYAQLKTYPEAAEMVEEVMSITNNTKAQTVYDMVKFAWFHFSYIDITYETKKSDMLFKIFIRIYLAYFLINKKRLYIRL